MHWKTIWTVLREAAAGWIERNATRLSAALAFYTILSIAPLFVIAIAIVGAVFGREAATGALTEQLRNLLGDAGAEVASTAVMHADHPTAGVVATIIGVISLLFGASGVFSELQDALNTIWNVKPKPGRGIWRTIRARFLSFGMVLVIGFLLLASLIATIVLAAFQQHLERYVPGTPLLLHFANVVLGFLLVTALFAFIFKVLPDAKIGWRDVWFGAGVTAALFTLGKYAIGIYLTQAGVASPFGAAGSVVVFLVWLYYSGLILFFGAELTQVTARRAGRWVEPADNAERVVPMAPAK